jgi:pimeloyl-ACP methyl ester carboxylesterase
MPIRRTCCFLSAVLLSPGCLALPGPAPQPSTQPPAHNAPTEGIVFIVDGAGGFQATSKSFRQTVAAEGLPLCIETVVWTHGYCRFLADQVHHKHLLEEGRRLAALIQERKQSCPVPVYLVGHSAGAGVALLALEQLPPGVVERVVLLAPAVSANYDLRPALARARGGIDVFYSDRDWAYLGLGVSLTGNADRHWGRAAGRIGFRTLVQCPEDAALYGRLRQHPWQRSLEWTGNHGGHYGGYQPEFLRCFVLPLLRPEAGALAALPGRP